MHPEILKKLERTAEKHKVTLKTVKAFVVPPEKRLFVLDGMVYRVVYVNQGKTTFTSEFMGPYEAAVKKGTSWTEKVKNLFSSRTTPTPQKKELKRGIDK